MKEKSRLQQDSFKMGLINGDEELISKVLQPCFPQSNNLKLVENFIGNDLDHFTSNILRVTIEYEQDKKLQRKQLVVKVPNNEARSYPAIEMLHWYDREKNMYEEILPRINGLLNENIAPLHYFTTNTRILVLENLSTRGFEEGEKRQNLTIDQCYLILKTLAKFHGASWKVHQDNPKIFDDPAFHNLLMIERRMNLIDTWLPILEDLLQKNNADYLITKLKASLVPLKDNKCYLQLNQHNFDFVVLNHGCCRKDNILFKKDDIGRINDIKFLDFQSPVCSSPVVDVIYLFLMSVPVDVVEANFDSMIEWYLKCFMEILHKFGFKGKYGKTEFMVDFKKLHFFFLLGILLTACINGPLTHDEIEDIFLIDYKDQTRSYKKCLDNEQFSKFIFGWLMYAEKLGIFDTLLCENKRESESK